MPGRRLSVRKIREMLRLHFACGLGVRQIARSLGVSHSTVSELLHRAAVAGLSWPLPEDLDDVTLEARLYPGNPHGRPRRPEPDWAWVHTELRRKGVTLQLLWVEYKQAHPDGYQYSRFCELYRKWRQKLDVVMRQDHRAGEKMFVDFAGPTVPYVEPATGDVRQAHVFVAVLGASSYTFARAYEAQDLPCWIAGHTDAVESFAGVPELVVSDQPKTATTRACRYEPDLHPTYREWAEHDGTALLPARPGHPRDKAKAEVAVQVVERWILAALRHRTFVGLGELNAAIAEALEDLNRRPLQKLGVSRRELYERLDRPALRPLPPERYVYAEWKKARASIDYHVEVERNHYSVPYTLAREEVEVRITRTTVEVFHRGRRVASPMRAYGVGRYVTDPQHMPAAHRAHREWSPSRLLDWASGIGPHTAELVRTLLASRPHPEQGYRACLGLMRLGRHYGPERLEAACARALRLHAVSFRSVQSILEHGLDRQPLDLDAPEAGLGPHPHVRGPHYYAAKGVTAGC